MIKKGIALSKKNPNIPSDNSIYACPHTIGPNLNRNVYQSPVRRI